MQWIEAKYNIANRTGEVVGERTTLLNLNHVRRILKGNNGEAIIRWNSNTANMTLNETYDSFNERLFGEIVEAPSP